MIKDNHCCNNIELNDKIYISIRDLIRKSDYSPGPVVATFYLSIYNSVYRSVVTSINEQLIEDLD